MSVVPRSNDATGRPLTNFERLAARIVHVPNTRRTVARARDDEPAITREVKRIYLLLMTFEDGPDTLLLDVPYLQKAVSHRSKCLAHTETYSDLFILGASSEILAVGAEAYAANVQIAGLARRVVDEHARFEKFVSRGPIHESTHETHQVFWPVFVS